VGDSSGERIADLRGLDLAAFASGQIPYPPGSQSVTRQLPSMSSPAAPITMNVMLLPVGSNSTATPASIRIVLCVTL